MDARGALLVLVFASVPGCQLPVVRVTISPLVTTDRGAGSGEAARNPEALVALGNLRAQAGFASETPTALQAHYREEARQAYQQALSIDPGFQPAHLALARLLQGMEDLPQATASLQNALRVHDRDASIWYELGMCQARQKQWGSSAVSLNRACALDPDNRKYANTLGFVLGCGGRPAEALASFSRFSSAAKSHCLLARALEYNHQVGEARQHLNQALRLDPQLRTARAMLQDLNSKRADPDTAIQTVAHSETVAGPQAPNPVPQAAPVRLLR